jgi:hypothetical protein
VPVPPRGRPPSEASSSGADDAGSARLRPAPASGRRRRWIWLPVIRQPLRSRRCLAPAQPRSRDPPDQCRGTPEPRRQGRAQGDVYKLSAARARPRRACPGEAQVHRGVLGDVHTQIGRTTTRVDGGAVRRGAESVARTPPQSAAAAACRPAASPISPSLIGGAAGHTPPENARVEHAFTGDTGYGRFRARG